MFSRSFWENEIHSLKDYKFSPDSCGFALGSPPRVSINHSKVKGSRGVVWWSLWRNRSHVLSFLRMMEVCFPSLSSVSFDEHHFNRSRFFIPSSPLIILNVQRREMTCSRTGMWRVSRFCWARSSHQIRAVFRLPENTPEQETRILKHLGLRHRPTSRAGESRFLSRLRNMPSILQGQTLYQLVR